MLEKCTICPRNCKVNRLSGKKGYCKCDDKIKIALVSTHMYEEPCISGKKGSGTIFFSNCNLNCVYCQNYEISQKGKGVNITIEELSEKFMYLQNKGVNNINLVTPTMYVYQIIEAIKKAKEKGLTIPIIYNSNGYENVETIKILNGYIDIYLPDLKYFSNDIAIKYSNAPNYFEIATKAIQEMYKQVGVTRINERGIMEKGLIIRHLILPNYLQNSKNILKWIKENIDPEVHISVMAQYFPTNEAYKYEKLNRKITRKEYKEIKKYIITLGMENGYFQGLESNEEKYVPVFCNKNVTKM